MTTDQSSFGKYLETERKLRNISIDEIAVSTKIKVEYLKAIESDEFERLPNETFIKGYIRAYAKFCGMNEDEVLINYEFFDQLNHGQRSDDESEHESVGLAHQKKLFYIILMALVLIAVFIFLWSLNHDPLP